MSCLKEYFMGDTVTIKFVNNKQEYGEAIRAF